VNPWIQFGGTVVAAIITGLFAATLKHRWDTATDQLKWERETAARRRQGQLDAFSGYLAARPTWAELGPLLRAAGAGATPDRDAVAAPLRLHAIRLTILLADAGDCRVIEEDAKAVLDWLAQADLRTPSAVPTPRAVIDLARRLIADAPAAEPARPGRRWWHQRSAAKS
jgi:hypothetical protein